MDRCRRFIRDYENPNTRVVLNFNTGRYISKNSIRATQIYGECLARTMRIPERENRENNQNVANMDFDLSGNGLDIEMNGTLSPLPIIGSPSPMTNGHVNHRISPTNRSRRVSPVTNGHVNHRRSPVNRRIRLSPTTNRHVSRRSSPVNHRRRLSPIANGHVNHRSTSPVNHRIRLSPTTNRHVSRRSSSITNGHVTRRSSPVNRRSTSPFSFDFDGTESSFFQ